MLWDIHGVVRVEDTYLLILFSNREVYSCLTGLEAADPFNRKEIKIYQKVILY